MKISVPRHAGMFLAGIQMSMWRMLWIPAKITPGMIIVSGLDTPAQTAGYSAIETS